MSIAACFFFSCYGARRDLHSFPTRRSSDLAVSRRACSASRESGSTAAARGRTLLGTGRPPTASDRKSTRLNSSHSSISYAVFCLKKKNKNKPIRVIHAGAVQLSHRVQPQEA